MSNFNQTTSSICFAIIWFALFCAPVLGLLKTSSRWPDRLAATYFFDSLILMGLGITFLRTEIELLWQMSLYFPICFFLLKARFIQDKLARIATMIFVCAPMAFICLLFTLGSPFLQGFVSELQPIAINSMSPGFLCVQFETGGIGMGSDTIILYRYTNWFPFIGRVVASASWADTDPISCESLWADHASPNHAP